jgi:hypothetical protein
MAASLHSIHLVPSLPLLAGDLRDVPVHLRHDALQITGTFLRDVAGLRSL